MLINYGCNRLPESTGYENTLTLVVSEEDQDLVLLYLEPLLNKPVYTPTIENLYDIDIINADNFKNNKFRKNIIIVSLSNPSDSNVDLLANKIVKQYNNQNIFTLYDLYSENQIIITLSSHDDIEFEKDIANNKIWLLDEINQNIEKNILHKINNSILEKDIINNIKENFSINLLVDENYEVIKQKPDFIWVGRGLPYRWIVINQVDKNLIYSSDYISVIKNELASKLTDVNILEYKLDIFYENDNSIVRGVYEHIISDTGGPFFTYIFENIVNNKVIFISGFLNNPGKSKSNLLLQLETIIKNVEVIQ
jgi:hypothetical protein